MAPLRQIESSFKNRVPAIACRGLRVQYGDLVAVDDLSLEIRLGECFGLLGPNGAGKTTTVEAFEGLIRPAAGEIEILGTTWRSGGDRKLRQRIGVALQATQFSEMLTVEETVRLFRSFYDRGRDNDEVIALLGLEEKRRARVGKLSGGQRQRLSLACALVSEPDILFLDEPTTGLDPQARLRIWEVVERFAAGGGTVLLTTHYMEEAAHLCQRVAIVDRGKLVALDSPEALVRELGADDVIELVPDGEAALEPFIAIAGVRRAQKRGPVIALAVDSVTAVLPVALAAAAAAGIEISSVATHQASLEDVFVHMTGRGLRDG
jgi:ABC-2 type transport system ATP-binding protein